MRAAPALLLAACGGAATAPTAPGVPLDVVVIPPEGVTLEAADLQVDVLVLDTCDGTLALPVGRTLDAVGPSEHPAHVLPGGWCGLQALLPSDGPPLAFRGARHGEPVEGAIRLGGIVVLGPFFVEGNPLLLRVPLPSLRDDEAPLVGELWEDRDDDGVVGEGDLRLR